MTLSPQIEWLHEGGVTSPQGFECGAARGGIKTTGPDVALIISQTPAASAAVFTRNLVQAAPVLVCAQHLYRQTTRPDLAARAIIINAGNANCCTGAQGERDAREMCNLTAQKLGCEAHEVLVCSTGIIGHPLPMDKVRAGIEAINVNAGEDANQGFARAIMTTDTRPKYCAAQTEINGQTVTIGGTIKGVGMIGPDMGPMQMAGSAAPHATMLAFLTTDAAVEKPLLQELLEDAAERSFNSVTVDGDTSTNDTAILLANAQGARIDDSNRAQFASLLQAVCVRLVQEVARDGEGATKLVTIEVSGASGEDSAKKIAMTIANSPLVKTAIFGRDPNWGRIAAAAGRSGANFNAKFMSIHIGGVRVFLNGEPTQFSQAAAEAAMSHDELVIRVVLGDGAAAWTAWTCDFSYDYVKINAEYHT